MTTARADLLIRATPAAAYAAFADHERICEFWLSSASGDLVEGARVDWEFLVPGAVETVDVIEADPDRQLQFRWGSGLDVDLRFDDHPDGVHVSVEATGFAGDDTADQAVDAAVGFAIVLCDLKTLLESGSSAGIIGDKAQLIAESMK